MVIKQLISSKREGANGLYELPGNRTIKMTEVSPHLPIFSPMEGQSRKRDYVSKNKWIKKRVQYDWRTCAVVVTHPVGGVSKHMGKNADSCPRQCTKIIVNFVCMWFVPYGRVLSPKRWNNCLIFLFLTCSLLSSALWSHLHDSFEFSYHLILH